jgi:uncharacterized membrane protein
MSNLIVIAFDNEYGADDMRNALDKLKKQELIKLDDAAVVIRKMDGKVKIKQATSLVGAGALGGAFWGMLIGLLFLAPWMGLAIGAITGGLAGKFTDIGVDDKFIKEVGSSIAPGNSAIFLLVRQAVADKVIPELRKFNGKIIQTSLSKEKEEHLREAFSAEQEKVMVA